MNNLVSCVFAAFLLSSSAYAGTACTDNNVAMDHGSAAIFSSCLMQVPGIKDGAKIRNYSIDKDGSFMVAEMYGSKMSDSGSRSYYFFPVERAPSLAKSDNGVIARTASGPAITFNSDGSIANMVGAKFKEDKSVNNTNKGGVEITYLDGILLDSGWSTGNQAIQNPNGKSTFKDRKGTTCVVTNSQIFKHTSKYDVEFMYKSNQALAAFLSKTCPHLDLSPLVKAGLGSDDADGAAAATVPAN